MPEDPALAAAARRTLANAPYLMGALERQAVLDAIIEVCRYRSWPLLAAHVRTTHVHVVVRTDCPPERAMNAFKSYASRALNREDQEATGVRRWARHGSTVYLWTEDSVTRALRYLIDRQGEPLALHVAEDPRSVPSLTVGVP